MLPPSTLPALTELENRIRDTVRDCLGNDELPPPFETVDMAGFNDQAADWAIEGIYERPGIMCTVGASAAGKSFIVISQACCIAAGIPWFGRATVQGPVLYVAAEGEQRIRRRILAWCNAHGIDPASLPLDIIPMPVKLGGKGRIDAARLLSSVLECARKRGAAPVLIVIDTMHRTMEGDENSARDVGQYIDDVDNVRRTCNATVVIVHHTGKDPSRGERGSSALRSAIHGGLMVEQLSEDSEGNKLVRVAGTKQKEDDKLSATDFHLVRYEWTYVSITPTGIVRGPTVSSCVLHSAPQSGGGTQRGAQTTQERMLAALVAAPQGLTGPEWEQAAGIGRSTRFAVAKRLMEENQVRQDGDRFVAI